MLRRMRTPLLLVFALATWGVTIYSEQTARGTNQPNPSARSPDASLPPLGDPSRPAALLRRAHDSYQSADWLVACEYYQMIIQETGSTPLVNSPQTKERAAQSFHKCARLVFKVHEDKKVETYLSHAEELGLRSFRHNVLRRKLVRRQYHRSLVNEDIEQAMALYAEYQARGTPDEDERIWLGDQLAQRAREALRHAQQNHFHALMSHLSVIAPQNRDYRDMKSAVDVPQQPLMRALIVTAVIILVIALFSLFSHWSAWAKVARAQRDHPLLAEDI
ncbi:MAG: hypothetical protein KTR25_01665 [Myxococcales bacterium]|nr:hypothetical protein [Myxococcales bacterium]